MGRLRSPGRDADHHQGNRPGHLLRLLLELGAGHAPEDGRLAVAVAELQRVQVPRRVFRGFQVKVAIRDDVPPMFVLTLS